jgi:hypothetical protein
MQSACHSNCRHGKEARTAAASIYRAAHKAIWIGEVEAIDEQAAIEKAAEQFKVPATKLMATRRRIPIDVAHDSGMMSPAIPR